jgi:hypothetical protein
MAVATFLLVVADIMAVILYADCVPVVVAQHNGLQCARCKELPLCFHVAPHSTFCSAYVMFGALKAQQPG